MGSQHDNRLEETRNTRKNLQWDHRKIYETPNFLVWQNLKKNTNRNNFYFRPGAPLMETIIAQPVRVHTPVPLCLFVKLQIGQGFLKFIKMKPKFQLRLHLIHTILLLRFKNLYKIKNKILWATVNLKENICFRKI